MEDTIRIVVAGAAGGRGSWFVRQLSRHAGYQVVALVDPLTEAARAVAEAMGLGGVPVFADTAEAVDQVACRAVLIAAPDGEHTEPVLASLTRGKHVYVEKPLAITLEDCLAVVRADRIVGGRTMVGLNLRYAPLYSALRQHVSQGLVGQPLTIQADEFYYGGRTYFRRWNRLRRYGGGLWITKACHDLDLLQWIAGAFPVRISATARLSHYLPRSEAGQRCSECPIEPTCPDSHLRAMQRMSPLQLKVQQIREANGWPPADLCLYNSEKDTFDHGMVQVTFDNDLLAAYTVNVVAAFTDRRMRIAGTAGTIEGSLSSNELLHWVRHQADDIGQVHHLSLDADPHTLAGHGGADTFLLDAFGAFVRGQPCQGISPAEASVAVAMGLAATRSADTEQTVAMQEMAGWQELCAQLSPNCATP